MFEGAGFFWERKLKLNSEGSRKSWTQEGKQLSVFIFLALIQPFVIFSSSNWDFFLNFLTTKLACPVFIRKKMIENKQA